MTIAGCEKYLTTPAESKARRILVRSHHWIASTLECSRLDQSARQAEAESLASSIPVGVLSPYSANGDAMTLAQQQELVSAPNGAFRFIHGVPHTRLLDRQVNRPVIDLILHISGRVEALEDTPVAVEK